MVARDEIKLPAVTDRRYRFNHQSEATDLARRSPKKMQERIRPTTIKSAMHKARERA